MKDAYIVQMNETWWMNNTDCEFNEIIQFLDLNGIAFRATEYTMSPHHSVIFNGLELNMDMHDLDIFKLAFTNKLLDNSLYCAINYHA